MDCFMRHAHGFFVRSGHEAECLALLEVDVGRVSADAELWSRFLQSVELCEKFRLRQLPMRKAALGLVVGVDEKLHVCLLLEEPTCHAYASYASMQSRVQIIANLRSQVYRG